MTIDVATKLFASLADYINIAPSNLRQYVWTATEKIQMLTQKINLKGRDFTAHASLFWMGH